MNFEKDDMIRNYAEGRISWEAMRARGLENYAEVLAGLHRLQLKQPLAPLEGPGVEDRRSGIESLVNHFSAHMRP